MKIVLTGWKVIEHDGGERKIAGEYAVKQGDTVIATSDFNTGGYHDTVINLPQDLIAEALALGDKIVKAIETHYTE